MGANHPMPYSASERAAGLAYGPQIRYLRDTDTFDDSRALAVRGEVLPALPEDAPIIHIGPRPEPQPAQHDAREARREPKLESDVLVPLAQATITAFAIGIPAALLTLAFSWPWRVPVVVFSLALAGAWLWRQRLVDALLWHVETWVDADLNHDGNIGRPVASYTVLQPAAARADVARETRTAATDEARAQLLEFVDACYIHGCGEHAHGVKATGPAREEYVKRRDTLIAIGVAAWKFPGNPKGGWKMVASRQRARALVEKHVLGST